jgi:predicted nucleic acid-binding protein
MILVDTSIWVDHLRAADDRLALLLDHGEVLTHPSVTGELALGTLRERELIFGALQDLPQAIIASDDEVLQFIDRQSLYGRGIGYVDAHLLTAVQLTPDAALWTRDRRLQAVAVQLGLAKPLLC